MRQVKSFACTLARLPSCGTVISTFALLVPLFGVFETARAQVRLAVHVWEHDPEIPIPCRVHLRDEAGQPIRPPEFPFWHDHFVFPGRAVLDYHRQARQFWANRLDSANAP